MDKIKSFFGKLVGGILLVVLGLGVGYIYANTTNDAKVKQLTEQVTQKDNEIKTLKENSNNANNNNNSSSTTTSTLSNELIAKAYLSTEEQGNPNDKNAVDNIVNQITNNSIQLSDQTNTSAKMTGNLGTWYYYLEGDNVIVVKTGTNNDVVNVKTYSIDREVSNIIFDPNNQSNSTTTESNNNNSNNSESSQSDNSNQ